MSAPSATNGAIFDTTVSAITIGAAPGTVTFETKPAGSSPSAGNVFTRAVNYVEFTSDITLNVLTHTVSGVKKRILFYNMQPFGNTGVKIFEFTTSDTTNSPNYNNLTMGGAWKWGVGITFIGLPQNASAFKKDANGKIYYPYDDGVSQKNFILSPSGFTEDTGGTIEEIKEETIKINAITPTPKYGDAPFALSLSSNTGAGTGAITYSSSNTAVASISGTTCTINGVGTVTITATKAPSTGYTGATDSWTFTVTANSYTVAFNGNGSTGGSTASQIFAYGTAQNLKANGFLRTGYTFKEWTTAANGTGTKYNNGALVNNLTSTNGATVTLYAQWTANSYTVAFNGNGNTGGSTASQLFAYGTAQNLKANGFSRTGYTFAGWNTASNGSGTSYAAGASVNNLTATAGGTVTLYAQWTANNIGASASVSSLNGVIGTAINKITFTITNDGTVGSASVKIKSGTLPSGLSLNTSDLSISGTPSAAYASAAVVFTVTGKNGTTADVTITFKIDKKVVEKPILSGTYTYNGSLQTATLTGFDAAVMTISGNTANNAGKQTITVALKTPTDFAWKGDANASFTIEWNIAKKAVTVGLDNLTVGVEQISANNYKFYHENVKPTSATFTYSNGGFAARDNITLGFAFNTANGAVTVSTSGGTVSNYSITFPNKTYSQESNYLFKGVTAPSKYSDYFDSFTSVYNALPSSGGEITAVGSISATNMTIDKPLTLFGNMNLTGAILKKQVTLDGNIKLTNTTVDVNGQVILAGGYTGGNISVTVSQDVLPGSTFASIKDGLSAAITPTFAGDSEESPRYLVSKAEGGATTLKVGGMNISSVTVNKDGTVTINGEFLGDEDKLTAVVGIANARIEVDTANNKFTATTINPLAPGKHEAILSYEVGGKTVKQKVIAIVTKTDEGGKLTGEIDFGSLESGDVLSYKSTPNDIYKNYPTKDKTLPDDIFIDDEGYAYFRLTEASGEDFDFKVYIGKRTTTVPPTTGEFSKDDISKSDKTLSIDTKTGYEYRVISSDGTVLPYEGKDWTEGEDGKTITFTVEAGKTYTVEARKIGTTTLQPGPTSEVTVTIKTKAEQSKEDITEEGRKAKEAIENLKNITEEEKIAAKKLIDDEVMATIDKITSGSSDELIDKATKEGKEKIIGILKDKAKDDIDEGAKKAKAEIEKLTNHTEEEKTAAKKLVDDQVTETKRKIDEAISIEDVSKVVTEGRDLIITTLKNTAEDEIDKSAKKAKDEIDKLSALSVEEKNAAKGEVDEKAATAKAAIKDAQTEQDVTIAVGEGKGNIFSVLKETAKENININTQKAKEEINKLKNLTESEKTAAKNSIDQKAAAAIAAIEAATNETSVGTAAKEGEGEINKVVKTAAITDIDISATKAKEEIEKLTNHTEEEKTAAKKLVDDQVTETKRKIDEAISIEDVSTVVTEGRDLIITTLKNTAEDEIDKSAKKAKDEIDKLSALSVEEKNAAKGEVDEKAATAKAAIKDAQTEQDVTIAVGEGKGNIFSVLKETAKENININTQKAKEEINKLKNLTESEKTAAKNSIDQKAAAAIAAIEAANDETSVGTAAKEGEGEINKVVKTSVNTDIDISATKAKAEIDKLNLTDDVKNAAKKSIDDKVTVAKTAIENLADIDGISETAEGARANILDIVKNTATNEIDKYANKAKTEIDKLLNLTAEERAAAKGEIDKAATKAKGEVALKTTEDGIAQIVSSVKAEFVDTVWKFTASDAISEIKAYLRADDNEVVKGIAADAVKAIEDGVSDGLINNVNQLDEIVSEAKQKIDIKRARKAAINSVTAKYNELIGSGKFGEKSKAELKDIYDNALNDLNAVDADTITKIEQIRDKAILDMSKVKAESIGNGVNPDDVEDNNGGNPPSYDNENGNEDGTISGIISGGDGFDSSLNLVIKKTDDDKNAIKKTEKQVKDLEVKQTFNVSLQDNKGNVVAMPNGNYKVSILLNENQIKSNCNTIVFIDAEGNVTTLNAKRQGNFIIFETEELGTFQLLGDKSLNLVWLIVLLSILALCEAAFLTFRIVKRVNNKEDSNSQGNETEGNEKANETAGKSEKLASSALPIIIFAALTYIPFNAIGVCVALGTAILVIGGGIAATYLVGKKKEQEPKEALATNNESSNVTMPIISMPIIKIPAIKVVSEGYLFAARYKKSYTARLVLSDDNTKTYYAAIKNALLSYDGVKSRTSWTGETFNKGRNTVAKMAVKGKTLEVYFALSPASLEESYRIEDASELKKFIDVPSKIKVNGVRSLKQAEELIKQTMEKLSISIESDKKEDYSKFLETRSIETLVEEGLIIEKFSEEEFNEMKKHTGKLFPGAENHERIVEAEDNLSEDDEDESMENEEEQGEEIDIKPEEETIKEQEQNVEMLGEEASNPNAEESENSVK